MQRRDSFNKIRLKYIAKGGKNRYSLAYEK